MVVESKTLYNDLLKQFKANKTERVFEDYDPEDEEHDIEDFIMEEYEVSLGNVKGLKWISGGWVSINKLGVNGVYSISPFTWSAIPGDISQYHDVFFDGWYGSLEDAVQAVYKELMSIENANKRKKYD